MGSLAFTVRMHACMGGAGACAHHAGAWRADAEPIHEAEPMMSASQTSDKSGGGDRDGHSELWRIYPTQTYHTLYTRQMPALPPAPRRARAGRGGDRREQLEAGRGLDDLRALRQREPARVRQRREHRQHVRGRQVRVLDQQPAPARHGLRAAGARARPSDGAAFAASEQPPLPPEAARRHSSRADAGHPQACPLTRLG